jgi:DNA-binding transcriptional LysR family regulator
VVTTRSHGSVALPSPACDPIRRELDNGLESVNVIAETNSLLTTLGCIRESAAIGFFPRLMIEFSQGVDDLVFLDLPALAWQRTLGVVRRRRSVAPAAPGRID